MEEDRLPRPTTGFLVKAVLQMTPDKGIGVFASQFIPAKTVVYEAEPLSYTEEEAIVHLETLPTFQERKQWVEHAYGSLGKICVDPHDIVRVNHSDYPTLFNERVSPTELKSCSIAVRDIKEGEELTEDYRTYSITQAYVNLCKRYGTCEVYEMENYSK